MVIGKSVSSIRSGDMVIEFDIPIALIGVDEESVYFIDCSREIQGLPYVHVFSKEWAFKNAVTGKWFAFECEAL